MFFSVPLRAKYSSVSFIHKIEKYFPSRRTLLFLGAVVDGRDKMKNLMAIVKVEMMVILK